MVNVHRTASRCSQPGIHFLLYDTLGLRVAATDGLLSIFFTLECFLRLLPGYRGSMRKSGISYPNQHIDSDCFFADLPVFRALLAYDTLRRTFVELEHRWQDSRLSRKGMHYEHFTTSLFCKHAAWGAIDSRFPSRPHADDL